jgi:hypothetical protein
MPARIRSAAQSTTGSTAVPEVPPYTEAISYVPLLVAGRVVYSSDPALRVVFPRALVPPSQPLPRPHDIGEQLFAGTDGLGLASAAARKNFIAAELTACVTPLLPRNVRRPLYVFNSVGSDADPDAIARLVASVTSDVVPAMLSSSATLRRSPTGQAGHAMDAYATLRALPTHVLIHGLHGPIDLSSAWHITPGLDVSFTDRRNARRLTTAMRATLLTAGDDLQLAPDVDALARVIDIASFESDGIRAALANRLERRSLICVALASYVEAGCPTAPHVSSRTAEADALLGGMMQHLGLDGYGARSTPEELQLCGVVDELAVLLAACAPLSASTHRPLSATQLYEEGQQLDALPRYVRSAMTEGARVQRMATWLRDRVDRSTGEYVLRGDVSGGAKAWRYRIERVGEVGPSAEVGGDV